MHCNSHPLPAELTSSLRNGFTLCPTTGPKELIGDSLQGVYQAHVQAESQKVEGLTQPGTHHATTDCLRPLSSTQNKIAWSPRNIVRSSLHSWLCKSLMGLAIHLKKLAIAWLCFNCRRIIQLPPKPARKGKTAADRSQETGLHCT